MTTNKLLFLSLAKDYWDGIVMSRHHVMGKLSSKHKVVFVSPQYNMIQVFNNIWKGILKKSEVTKVNDNLLSIIPPKIFPRIHCSQNLDKLLLGFFIKYLQKIIKQIDYDKLILYLWNPRFYEFIGKFNENLVCYHVHDQFKGYAIVSAEEAKQIEIMEEYVLKRADIVFANGEMLAMEKNKYNNTYNVPSAVDYDYYNNVYMNIDLEPFEMQNIPKPRIGYAGRITRKVNFDLIVHLADKRPEYSFVFIGPVNLNGRWKENFEKLYEKDNFYHIAEKPVNMLPLYTKCLDVGLMNYVINEHTKFVFPLKLFEYLALGKPVIGSDMECFKPYKDIVRIAIKTEDWLTHIEKCLIEKDDPNLIDKRRELASQNSWDNRVATIEKIVFQNL
ncbi:putative Glycosyltransferase I domain-containing protein [Candidatus Magnetomoraceae bacterium gMMP-1]